jgi:hypothetical protein
MYDVALLSGGICNQPGAKDIALDAHQANVVITLNHQLSLTNGSPSQFKNVTSQKSFTATKFALKFSSIHVDYTSKIHCCYKM